MKKIIIKFMLLLLYITIGYGQTYDLQFVEILNDKTVAGNYDVQVQIRSSSVFKMATSNITFDFNSAGLSSPTLLTAHNYSNAPFYVAMTVTNPNAGVASVNITFPHTDAAFATDVPISWNPVATIRFTIDNTTQSTAFSYRSTTPNNTKVNSCTGSGVTFTVTQLAAGSWTSLDVSLPVELTAFTAEDGVDGVFLKWTTESEIENLGFELERRTEEAKDWKLIASYKTDDALGGQGNYSSATDYEYIDNLVENGVEYEYRLSDVDYNAIVTYHATRFVTANNFVLKVIPETFELFEAYPNPFNPHVTIKYDTPVETIVRISIYNHIGQKVRVLQNSPVQPGEHSVVWDSRDDNGQPMSAGVYFFNIEAGEFNKTHKMILLK